MTAVTVRMPLEVRRRDVVHNTTRAPYAPVAARTHHANDTGPKAPATDHIEGDLT